MTKKAGFFLVKKFFFSLLVKNDSCPEGFIVCTVCKNTVVILFNLFWDWGPSGTGFRERFFFSCNDRGVVAMFFDFKLVSSFIRFRTHE